MSFARRHNCTPHTQPVALSLAGPPRVLLAGILGAATVHLFVCHGEEPAQEIPGEVAREDVTPLR